MVIGQPVPITQGSSPANRPDLSPDGEWLVFSSQEVKEGHIFIIRRDGTGRRQLTEGVSREQNPRWSPDGSRIAFFSNRSGRDEFWIINADGSGLRQLTYMLRSPGLWPVCVWSPDGKRLAYSTLDRNACFIMEVGKTWQEQTPQALPPASNGYRVVSWSPDGRKLAGFGKRSGIVVYSLESQQYEQLTDFGAAPVWLSDNRRLLFTRGSKTKFCLVDSQSKKVHEILSVAPHGSSAVTLSRDDRQIYFTLRTIEQDIWLMSR